MNLDHLRYFIELSQSENYTQTAKSLHITQPSLTKAIHSLESEINVQLFEKKGRNVTLTTAGKIFSKGVGSALLQLDRSVSEIEELNSKKTTIQIGALRTLSIDWLPSMVQRFQEETNDTSIKFQFSSDTGLSPDILNSLREKKYDVAFCSRMEEYGDIEYFPIEEQNMVCITPLQHDLANRSSLALRETLPYPQVVFSKRSGLYSVIERMFENSGGHPIGVYSVEEDQAMAGLVAHGFGIAITPDMELLHTMPLKVIPISYPKWKRVFYMATLKRRFEQPEVEEFVNFVRKESKKNLTVQE
ncbi:LysR substrate-binding domain-containing protein [Companilactobacillus baiquanensis]|uniref:LysR substrate-binding domain-containing protein n=1 Tax=Companilactobacillus baiquanensis TaxID=2486005 RepID=A0ABW1UVS8_9LACO|nr:LysR substrate-binding domain-containing protein [Companilactobacillus baiquanensis]